jgi:hypothetical protein
MNIGLKKLQEFLDTGTESTSICDGLQIVNASMFAKVVDKFKETDLYFEDHGMFLGCSCDREVITNDLQAVLNSSKTDNETAEYLMKSIYGRNEVTAEVTLDFIIDNFERLLDE